MVAGSSRSSVRDVRLPGEVAGIDGMRAMAAFAVVVFHVAFGTLRDPDDPLARLVSRLGNGGVAVFFVLSGFLLYRPFVSAAATGARVVVWRFYWNRAVRVYPAYWVALTLTLLVFEGTWERYSAGELTRIYALVHTYDPDLALAGLEVSWTLVVEISFYLALPFLALIPVLLRWIAPGLGNVGSQLVFLTLLYVSAVLFRVVMFDAGDDRTFMLWLPAHFDVFALGMLLAVVDAQQLLDRDVRLARLARLARRTWLWWSLAAVAYLGMVALDLPRAFGGGGRATSSDLMARWFLDGVMGFLLVLPLVARSRTEPSRGTRALAVPLIAWLGTISYGVYLWHIAVRDQVYDWADSGTFARLFWPVLALVSTLTIAVAALSYYTVERSAMKAKVSASASSRTDASTTRRPTPERVRSDRTRDA